jgi:hypothetical protein
LLHKCEEVRSNGELEEAFPDFGGLKAVELGDVDNSAAGMRLRDIEFGCQLCQRQRWRASFFFFALVGLFTCIN